MNSRRTVTALLHELVVANADRIIDLLHEAKSRPPGAARECFLAEACGADAALKEQIVSLLAAVAGEGDSDFLKNPSLDRQNIPLTEKPGDRIGRYKLLQQIGEGGCGVVYMAEQEEPVRRRVALKVIKLGMDTKQVIARFEAERQALAMMDHPNIAKIYDAGVTGTPVVAGILPAVEPGFQPGGSRGDDSKRAVDLVKSPGGKMPPSTAGETPTATLSPGRPYFVMELVRGVKITEFCDANRLITGDRLKLFIQVCQAIQHAHQKGVIHRDIKPSNILVTVNDGVPVPKVIDFGIAKATAGRLTDQTLFTAFEQFIGTPAYMSPEQAVMTSLDIDTRSDIYSLGVLLYELLTGSPPFDQKELLAAGLDEMRRTIREVEPVKPSTRLTQELVAAPRQSAADSGTENGGARPRRRYGQIQELIHLLRGDLDWIVMKCLEKDRSRRYETANGLAMDIARHLNCEPVTARPPSRLYEFQKTVRRHKSGFAAAAAVIMALAIGLGISLWQFVQKNRAYQRASQAEQEQTRQRELAERREKQSQQVAQFLKDMLEGVGPSVALGRDTAMLREILNKTVERVGHDLKDQPEVEAELRSTIGRIYHELGEFQKAHEMHSEALRLRKALFGETNLWVAASLSDVGYALEELARRSESETVQQTALAMRRELLGSDQLDVAQSLDRLADAQFRQSKLKESEAARREALGIRRKLLGNDSVEVADSLNDLSMLLVGLGKLEEAEAVSREARAICRKLPGGEHPSLATSLWRLSWVLYYQGRLDEAETTAREAFAMRRRLLGDTHPYTLSAMDHLSSVLQRQGNYAEAVKLRREELALRKKVHGEESMETLECLGHLASALKLAGDPIGAEATSQDLLHLQRNTLDRLREKLPPDDPQLATILAQFALELSAQQKFTEAEALARESLAIREKSLPEAWPAFNSRSILGGSLLGQGKYAEAEPFLLSGYEGMKQREQSTPRIWIMAAIERLAQLYDAIGKPDRAADWKQKLAEIDQGTGGSR